ncbi:aminopeptidase P family protein [Nitrosophilus alvini]|uniref:aminopeptidase P family protein n=1 Tax=Nitrosophilus alvini TaxID=2714855 RepID=UPI00190DC72C|nr:aminopeptidase P family protein [Nitrosophilus alvini]
MDSYIVRSESAQFYECGYSCDNAIFLKFGDEAFFITDGRYIQEAKESAKSCEVVESRDLEKAARELIRKNRIKRIVFDPYEWSIGSYEKLSSGMRCRFVKRAAFSHKKRVIKNDEEIELIHTSVKINADIFEKFALYLSKEGMEQTEKRLHFEAEAMLRGYGERSLSFDPIFAIGENAAKPHAIPTQKRLKSGDLVLFDAGVRYKRYCSDRTRTAYFGERLTFEKMGQTFSSRQMQKVYDTVLKAQESAIESIRTGMKACNIDKIARDIIEKAGFGRYFVHSTGHGVGLDIHEMPYISPKSDTVIEEGMVFTVEPGIYIPDKFGVRIEDMVVVKNGRAEIL